MKKQILSEEFKRMQKLAGITEIQLSNPDKQSVVYYIKYYESMGGYEGGRLTKAKIYQLSTEDIKVFYIDMLNDANSKDPEYYTRDYYEGGMSMVEKKDNTLYLVTVGEEIGYVLFDSKDGLGKDLYDMVSSETQTVDDEDFNSFMEDLPWSFSEVIMEFSDVEDEVNF